MGPPFHPIRFTTVKMKTFICFFAIAVAKCEIDDKGWEKCPGDKYWSLPTVLFVISRKCRRADLQCELEVAPKRTSYAASLCTHSYSIQLSEQCEALLVPGNVQLEKSAKVHTCELIPIKNTARLLYALPQTHVVGQTTQVKEDNDRDQHEIHLQY